MIRLRPMQMTLLHLGDLWGLLWGVGNLVHSGRVGGLCTPTWLDLLCCLRVRFFWPSWRFFFSFLFINRLYSSFTMGKVMHYVVSGIHFCRVFLALEEPRVSCCFEADSIISLWDKRDVRNHFGLMRTVRCQYGWRTLNVQKCECYHCKMHMHPRGQVGRHQRYSDRACVLK